MRILSVSNFFETHGGGLERVAGQLCRAFLSAGHQADWAACDNDGLPDHPAQLIALRCANPIERYTGLPMPLPSPRSMLRLWRSVGRAEVVVIHDALYAGSVSAMVMAKIAGKPVILIQHIGSIRFSNPVLSLTMRLANRLVTQPMMKAANRVVFISATVREEFNNIPLKQPAILAFNGVDHAIFHADTSTDPANPRAAWGLPVASPLLVFVGRFVEKKGLVIIRALAERRPDLHFALIGKGLIDPQNWDLKNVQTLGQLDQRSLASLYRAADILILPSVGEGYPLVVQEAMACGLPVVTGEVTASADPNARSFLEGVAIDPTDPTGSAMRCAQAIDRILQHPPDVATIADYARRTYNWQIMADLVIQGIALRARCSTDHLSALR